MTRTQTSVVLRHLRHLMAVPSGPGLTDHQLLERFTSRREEAAFAALVRRHGPLVLSVCRRVLHDWHDTEEAFQATFLVLARKGGTIAKQGSVGGWLYQVAYHLAVRARKAARLLHEKQAAEARATDPLEKVSGRVLLAALDEELQRLPERFRAPLVLCYLEGKTRDEAARELGYSLGTLKRRLEEGRERLREQLRRGGLSLPAALLALGTAGSTVPAALASSAARAALLATTGGTAAIPARVTALVSGLLPAVSGRLKAVGAVLVVLAVAVGAGLFSYRTPAAGRGATAAAKEPKRAPAAKESGGKEAAGEKKESAITGRILGADGKPLPGARVTAYAILDLGNLSVEYSEQALGETKTDDAGRFRLELPKDSAGRLAVIHLLAGAKGHGPAWSRLSPAGGLDAELSLPKEETVTGRLIDLQGLPVAKAKLRPIRVLNESAGPPPKGGEKGTPEALLAESQRRQRAFEFHAGSCLKDRTLWPTPVTTDADGKFHLTGFGRGQEVDLVVEDDRFARQEIVVRTDGKDKPADAAIPLIPPQKVTGRVVASDTGKPVADASLLVLSFHDNVGHCVEGRTDADGRYAVNAFPGEQVTVEVYPRRGEPYLGAFKSVAWPKGTVKQEIDVTLPRGVLVRGKVVEAGGKPLRSAGVAFLPQRENNPRRPRAILTGEYHKVFTGADGGFQFVVPPGLGRLVAYAPTDDYAYTTVSEEELVSGKPGGAARYFHAVLPLDLKEKDGPKDITVELRRAVTVKVRVVGPDGKPVKHGVVFFPGELAPGGPEGMMPLVGLIGVPFGTHFTALPVRDGAFELPRCDPDKTYRVFVLDGRPYAGGEETFVLPRRLGAEETLDGLSLINRLLGGKDRLGAVAEVSAKKAVGKPVEVKLAPCGTAEVRCVGPDGKPVAGKLWLELIVKPGPSLAKSRGVAKLAAEAALLAVPDSLRGEKSPLAPDDKGLITIPALIPGATYRLKVLTGPPPELNEIAYEKDFTAESGKVVKLPDVVFEKPSK
jgi:RNA polymerase sigma factor (sigma-70 family)